MCSHQDRISHTSYATLKVLGEKFRRHSISGKLVAESKLLKADGFLRGLQCVASLLSNPQTSCVGLLT